MSYSKETFTSALSALRQERGLTQQAVAGALGISDRTYSKWETGENEPDFASLSALADFFGVRISRFFGEADTETTVITAAYDNLSTADAVQKCFELQFHIIRGLAQREFNALYHEHRTPDNSPIEPPLNRVAAHGQNNSCTAYTVPDVMMMMYNGSDANIALSLLPAKERYSWLTTEREALAEYLSLLGDTDMLTCLNQILADDFSEEFTADYLAKEADISEEKAVSLLERAENLEICRGRLAHIGQRTVNIYSMNADQRLTALLTLAHLLLPGRMQCGHIYFNAPAKHKIAEVKS